MHFNSQHLALLNVYKGIKNTSYTKAEKWGNNLASIFLYRLKKNVKKSFDNLEIDVSSNSSLKMLSDEERDIDVESDDDGR